MPKDEHRLTMKEIGDHLQVSKNTIGRWLTGKGMLVSKVGRTWLFKLLEINGWVRNGVPSVDVPGASGAQ